jgi:DNA (cytosine-5)-methyltransferase 1
MTALYNDSDKFCAEWLQNLILKKHIPRGVVESCEIQDLQPEEILDHNQFHAFAGIGGWAHALSLAGWPEDLTAWTGSCPCQPFSVGGKREKFEDKRHLWPAWFKLIEECMPSIIFGEQVASPDGRAWLDVVSTDLETLGYAVGAADLCAAGVGAPHVRQRLWFVGYSNCKRLERWNLLRDGANQRNTWASSLVVDSWKKADWLYCQDGKNRPVEPGTFPLVNGVPARVGRLRAYGNAIAPGVATFFILACMDILGISSSWDFLK